jgi:hypothetical protein
MIIIINNTQPPPLLDGHYSIENSGSKTSYTIKKTLHIKIVNGKNIVCKLIEAKSIVDVKIRYNA